MWPDVWDDLELTEWTEFLKPLSAWAFLCRGRSRGRTERCTSASRRHSPPARETLLGARGWEHGTCTRPRA